MEIVAAATKLGIDQSRSQSPRSSVRGIMGPWEKAQKNARNSLHSITTGSNTLGSA